MSAPRLAKGGRKIVEQLQLDISAARSSIAEARKWNARSEKLDVEDYLQEAVEHLDRLDTRIRYELELMLKRREDNAPSLSEEIAEIKEQIAALGGRLERMEQDRRPPLREIRREGGKP